MVTLSKAQVWDEFIARRYKTVLVVRWLQLYPDTMLFDPRSVSLEFEKWAHWTVVHGTVDTRA